MARTALLYLLPALLVVAAWLRLEAGDRPAASAVGIAFLALLPALAARWWSRLAVALLVAPMALARAFDLPLSLSLPREAASELKEGALAYYDVSLPFDPVDEPLMHGAALTAVFAFCLLVGLALAARRPLLAGLALVAGAAWPATLLTDANRTASGVLLLVAVLGLLAWGGRRPARAVRPAVIAGALVVVAAVAAGTQPAVAKGEFLGWKGWDPYDQPADPVGVDYVWDASYDGIQFPDEETTVLTVTGPRRAQRWRAATLDEFRRDRWVEAPALIAISDQTQTLTFDPLLPPRALAVGALVGATVKIEALRDDHLVAPGTPVVVEPRGIGMIQYRVGNVAVVDGGLERGDTYAVRSYVPQPRPRQLARVRPVPDRRNMVQSTYMEIAPGASVGAFGADGRAEHLANLVSHPDVGPMVRRYLPLFRRAEQVTRGASNQYAAVVAIESWFRSRGGFSYDETPPRIRSGAPPLVDFVERTKAGYCQHFAGAMALMLRYLGIPARVAVGFTSGTYDEKKRRWTVTDHDAHAWVEVWFEGWGWLPFDPTPTRGIVESTFSTASSSAAVTTGIYALLRRENLSRGQAPAGPAEGTEAGGRDLPGDFGGTVGAAARRGGSLLKLLGLVALLGIGLLAAAKLGRRRVRYLTRNPRRLARAIRAELAEILLDQGLSVPRSATPHELAEVLRGELRIDGDRFADALAAARFGRPARASAAARQARTELRSIERLLRKRLTNAERARGFISLRSLGFGSPA